MSPIEIAILLAMTAFAIYRQTRRNELNGPTRFKLAMIYGIVGLSVGGFQVPEGGWEVGILAASLAISVAVGLLRGKYTRVWIENGVRYSQGTKLTVGLFLGMLLSKVALGTVAYFQHVSDDGGFGEILLMVAVMMAFQAQLVWRRAVELDDRPTTSPASASSQIG